MPIVEKRVVLVLVGLLLAAGIGAACGSAASTKAAEPVRVSRCTGSNAEPIQAGDGRYVYEAWIGCRFHIGFARSTDGGRTFGPARPVPTPSLIGRVHEWDPAVAVAPNGTVYVAYMVSSPSPRRMVPAVAVSTDHGATFARVSKLPIPTPSDARGNWGDRDFIAVGPDGTVYVTWDYGPSASEVRLFCVKGGSCAFSGGDFNGVLQRSTDEGRTWTKPTPVTPHFPLGGVYSAPIVVERGGALDVLYWQHPTNPKTRRVSAGTQYFTRSTDGGATWSRPVPVDPGAGKIDLVEWWIDGALAADPAGNLYATWDTQSNGRDTAWIAWSTDHGRTWSHALRIASSNEENLVQVAAAGPRDVYVGRQTVIPKKGYATYLRRLSIGRGWTGPAKRISSFDGNPKAWPGDTIGLSTRSGAAVVSWGSALPGSKTSQIYATVATLPK